VVTSAWFQVLTSKLARTEDPITMHLYTGWVGALLASLALPFVWTCADRLDMAVGWAVPVMGLMGTWVISMLILAYKRAPAATLTPYLYAQIGFAMLGGWHRVLAHVPDGWSLVGIRAGGRLRRRRAPGSRCVKAGSLVEPVES
jgi:drug/metabolite transporter (DMT)-like permease